MSQEPRQERILFITGRLAAPTVKRVVGELAGELGFTYEIAELGVSVAALLTTNLVDRKLQQTHPTPLTDFYDRAILPGWCQGEVESLSARYGVPFQRGPKDVLDLPLSFGKKARRPVDFSQYDIEILAEINHAPRLPVAELVRQANELKADGADVIDLGDEPGVHWRDVAGAVAALRDAGHRVSIDSFQRETVEQAVQAGAELVLSCNRANARWLSRLPVEVVAIPDDPADMASLDDLISLLSEGGTRFRIDPILEPIGIGFADSLGRYHAVRRRWPDVEIMMGTGNLTELTDVDSAGINVLLAGFCQELGIRSVLTTQVINWCRSSVKELDLARRMMRHAVHQRTIPKHLSEGLLFLRDPTVPQPSAGELDQLASALRDPNFRVFVEGETLHLMNRDGHWRAADPFELFDRALAAGPAPDLQHAFYLGYELAKAVTARTLGKRYRQDEPLRWGMLTAAETSAQARRHAERSGEQSRGDTAEEGR